MDFQKVCNWIDKHRAEMVDLQAGLTAIPALSPENGGDGEWAKARFLEDYLVSHGFASITHYDCSDSRVPVGTRPNLVASVPGVRKTPCYWILAHMDVVPPGDQLSDGSWKGWDADPYELQQAGDLIVGRGVTDDQQAIVTGIFALRALLENGYPPAHTVNLLFVSDEETGSHFGLGYVLRKHRDVFSAEDIIVVPDHGTADSTALEVAEKGALWIEFRVKGNQAHASTPDDGVNAFRAASRLVYLLDKELHARFDRIDHLYSPPHSTFEPTLHERNVPNVNTIPGEDVFCFDCRVLPQYQLDAVIDHARAQARHIDSRMNTQTTVRIRNRQDAPPPTPADAMVVRALKQAIREVYDVDARPMGIGGQTVAAHFREAGIPVAVWMTALQTAHQANETCSIEFMAGDAKVFARMFATPMPVRDSIGI